MFGKSWKTTVAGITAIVGAVVSGYFMFATASVTPEKIMGLVSALLVGIGLIFAKDGDVTTDNGMTPKA